MPRPKRTSSRPTRCVARAYAFAVSTVRDRDPEKARLYLERAIKFLQHGADHGGKFGAVGPFFEPIVHETQVQRMQPFFALNSVPAIWLARQGDVAQARQELEKFLQTKPAEHDKLRVEALVASFLGEDEEGMRRLERAIDGKHDLSEERYRGAAAAYSLAVLAAEKKHPERAKAYADRAAELLAKRVPHLAGASISAFQRELLLEPQFAPVRDHPGVQRILKSLQRYEPGGGLSAAVNVDGAEAVLAAAKEARQAEARGLPEP